MCLKILALICALSLAHAALPLPFKSRGGRQEVAPIMTTLYDGQKMPLVGLGIGNLPHEQIVPAVKEAVSLGIRLIDTAAASKNEHILARALNEVKFGDNVKILTKVWYTHLGYERTKRAVYESINNLGRTSIDIVILHWPRCNDEIEWMHCEDEEAALPDVDKETGPPPGPDSWKESWAALEDLYTAGKVKMIGVSNFNVEEMKELELIAKVKPHLMQGNVWSLIFDPTLMHVLRQNKVHFQAYNALNGVLPSLTIGHNADPVQRSHNRAAWKYLGLVGKELTPPTTEAQLVLLWLVEQGIGVIPRTARSNHLHDNAAINHRPHKETATPDGVHTTQPASLTASQMEKVTRAVEGLLRSGAGLPPSIDFRKEMGISTDTEMGRRRPEDRPTNNEKAPGSQAVVLHNVSPRKMKLYWDDKKPGSEGVFQGEIEAGDQITQTTFEGHTFIWRDAEEAENAAKRKGRAREVGRTEIGTGQRVYEFHGEL